MQEREALLPQRPLATLPIKTLLLLASLVCGFAAQAMEPADGIETSGAERDTGVGALVTPAVGQYGTTELMAAVRAADLARVDQLLLAGSVVDAKDHLGSTALIVAAASGSEELVARLLAGGADPNLADNGGETPLSVAIQHKHTAVAVALLRNGANPNVHDIAFGNSPQTSVLARASTSGQIEVVRLLLGRNVDLDAGGLEALNGALWRHHEDVAELLIQANIDLNEPAFDEKTRPHAGVGSRVLQTAAKEGLASSVELLLRNGANIDYRDSRGRSALSLAARENHWPVVALLLKEGAAATSNDLAAALDGRRSAEAMQLLDSLDLRSLGLEELDFLLAKADRANSTEILEQLFAAKRRLKRFVPIPKLLFARAGDADCQLFLWDLSNEAQTRVQNKAGHCDQQLFLSRSDESLYIISGRNVRFIPLDDPALGTQLAELPLEMIEANLMALKERVSASYKNTDVSWMTARVTRFGKLDSGKLAFATHSSGPAGETYGVAYVLGDGKWRVAKNWDCHRFDACRFEQILSASIAERPGDMTVWHPNIRLNMHFLQKVESDVSSDVGTTSKGTVTLEIDGTRSSLHYEKEEAGHCTGECTYTTSLSLELSDGRTVVLNESRGNNAIVDRYALVRAGPGPLSELIDMRTGKSVFGKLQVAGWVY